ncbi:MAG: glycosyltransferase, partial [Acidobacteria bacterium]|nr:glycosyltransferase [Acidobacteriota bacterium]
PVTVLEAMSHGCVVVGTAIGGLEELVEDSGGSCAVGDVAGAVKAVVAALEESTWRELSARTVASVAKFAPPRIVDLLVENYQRAIAHKALPGTSGTR